MSEMIVCLSLVVFSSKLIAQGINPIVSMIINRTHIDSLTTTVAELSGLLPVTIDGTVTTITSRYDTAAGNGRAAVYLSRKLQQYGLNPEFQDFPPSGRNVIAKQIGLDHPTQQYVICAHYDDQPVGITAPGADDNGSGTAAVIEAARILSRYTTSYSIVYALWDMEEEGLLGSSFYAGAAAAENDTILGVINLDMIGYDSNNDLKMDIHTHSVANSLMLADTIQFVNSTYGIGLFPVLKNPGTGSSDHASFWSYGYSAVLLIESLSNFNLYYHTVNDDLEKFNNPFFLKMSKLALGAIALLAGVREEIQTVPLNDGLSTFNLNQNFPNPFNPITTIGYRLPRWSRVKMEIFDLLGRKIETLVDETEPAGYYEVRWNAEGYPSGIYICRLQTGIFLQIRRMVFLK